MPIADASFEPVISSMAGHRAGGPEPVDIWLETRVRHSTSRRAWSGCGWWRGTIGDATEAEVAGSVWRIEGALRERSGPRGWRHGFAGLYALARRPG